MSLFKVKLRVKILVEETTVMAIFFLNTGKGEPDVRNQTNGII